MKVILKTLLIVTILTILTQVGGIIYLIYKPLGAKVKVKTTHPWKSRCLRGGLFLGLLLISSLIIIPPVAKQFGRVNLPIVASDDIPLRPASFFSVICNRHYVKPELQDLIVETSRSMNKKYPGTKLLYLDANFPFLDGFSLLPHLSHNDGEKLDINFLYQHAKTKKRLNRPPSVLGYGYVEVPKQGEHDQVAVCKDKGHWQYSLLSRLTFQRKPFLFDDVANKDLLEQLSRSKAIGKIFIEPHLKQRLGLANNKKVRYHGCHAVRHDDHIHLQLK